MAKKPALVLLRDLDAPGQKTKPFEPEHAARLLNYPGTRWAKPEGSDDEKKSDAAVASNAPAADLPPSDATNA